VKERKGKERGGCNPFFSCGFRTCGGGRGGGEGRSRGGEKKRGGVRPSLPPFAPSCHGGRGGKTLGRGKEEVLRRFLSLFCHRRGRKERGRGWSKKEKKGTVRECPSGGFRVQRKERSRGGRKKGTEGEETASIIGGEGMGGGGNCRWLS